MDKAFKVFNKDLNKGNKQLKEQNKLLSKNLQTMKLMRMVGGGLKMGLGALGIGAGIGGLVSALTKPYSGNLSTNLRAKNIGLSVQEHDALGFAGKMTGLGEDTLISAIEGLTTAIEDPNVWTHFSSLGLNIEDLQKKNPTEAFFDVLKSMKNSKLPNYIIKETIDSIGIPFDSFRFILKEGTGELEKFFKEGLSLNTYTEEDKQTGKSKDITGKVNKKLMEAEQASVKFTESFAGVMSKISFDIAPSYIKGLETATPLLNTFGETLSKGITSTIDFFTSFAKAEDKGEFLKDKASGLITLAGEGLKSVWDGITDYFKKKWDELVESITLKFKALVTDIKIFFNNALVPISFGQLSYLTKNEDGEAVIDIAKMEEARKTGFFKKTWNLLTGNSINDGVITKEGKIIKTNPKDYIFAMKHPQDLATAGAGNHTYTININANVKNDNDIRKLKTELERLIRSFNSKR